MTSDRPEDDVYLVRDAFGTGYAEAYGIRAAIPVTGSVLPDDARLSTARIIVALHAGRDDDLRDALDRAGFDRGVPTVGVELLPTRIVCGPAVIPGATACHACYRRRIEQHRDPGRPYDLSAATRDLPEGFGRPHLAVTHGLLGLALAEMRGGPVGLGGTVRTFDLVAGTLSSASTVAVDRCRRCGARFRDGAPAGAGAVAGLP
ncbi:cyclodehydratase [Actinoplanes sp. SE50]|uniref:cyclodehydratase n=1 Tax=unclassified Actinoplanes TaxID=2626549 RepID=UPI00023EC479|nr:MULTISPECIES: cyclodehydratase [unclassified Actinoplanes]AEV84644.1 hypothetical protein ACPL_3749 [Actinoplanes sp. SE50/110]ATO83036.1 cyclodehydratase [Actinoplanes sp. SE50]SLM00444.1 cyclodehydratase [Actinoplanes sp. SE50/110]